MPPGQFTDLPKSWGSSKAGDSTFCHKAVHLSTKTGSSKWGGWAAFPGGLPGPRGHSQPGETVPSLIRTQPAQLTEHGEYFWYFELVPHILFLLLPCSLQHPPATEWNHGGRLSPARDSSWGRRGWELSAAQCPVPRETNFWAEGHRCHISPAGQGCCQWGFWLQIFPEIPGHLLSRSQL